jgi:hypothetical protein
VTGGRRYGWFLALAAAALIVYVSLNTLSSQHVGSAGLKAGTRVPPFAAPLALGPLDAPVNIARKPNQGNLVGNTPACKVRGPGILNSCQLGERGPFVLAFLATRGARCTRELDALQRVAARHRDLQLAAISIRGNRDDLRKLVREHGWRFPVAWDLDGRLANLFGVAVCPQLTYVLPGGIVHDTTIGELDTRGLDARLTSLERAAGAKGWRP